MRIGHVGRNADEPGTNRSPGQRGDLGPQLPRGDPARKGRLDRGIAATQLAQSLERKWQKIGSMHRHW
jgi:hypothetical protein